MRDRADAFQIGRPRLQPHDVRLLQLQLRGVFAGDDALAAVDVVGQAVQQRRLARAGAAGDDDVAADAADDLEDLRARWGNRAEAHELIERQLVLLELTNGERGAVDRQRRRDHVDAGAVEQARVADRRGFVDTPADLADDALADVHQLRIVAEAHVGELDLAADFDEGASRPVDHDVGDVVARQQRLERPEAEHVVADVVEQVLLLGDRQHQILDRDDLVHDVANFFARALLVELRQRREVDRLDQRAEDHRLGLEIAFRPLLGLTVEARRRRREARAAAPRLAARRRAWARRER